MQLFILNYINQAINKSTFMVLQYSKLLIFLSIDLNIPNYLVFSSMMLGSRTQLSR